MKPIPSPDLPVLAQVMKRYEGVDPAHVDLDEATAAACLDVQRKTLESWRANGKELPFIKIGRSVRYRLADVLACRARNTFATTRAAMTRDRSISGKRGRRAS